MSDPESHPASAGLERIWFIQGLRQSIGLPTFILAATFIGIGSTAASVGMPLLWGILATLLIWAGPAYLILVGGLATGAPWLAIAVSVSLSSVRLLTMVVSILPYLRSGRARPMALLFCSHAIAISLWVEGQRLLPSMPPEQRVPFFAGLSTGYMSIASVANIVGFMLAGSIAPPFAAALLFLTPIFFLLSLIGTARAVIDGLAIAAGFVGLLAAARFGDGLELMWAGVGGGTLAYLAGRLSRARRA